jgi:hypothetical protein
MTAADLRVHTGDLKSHASAQAASFEHADSLHAPNTGTDVMAIQSRYAQTQLQTYALQAQALGICWQRPHRGIQLSLENKPL